jgi:hypothetical protein
MVSFRSPSQQLSNRVISDTLASGYKFITFFQAPILSLSQRGTMKFLLKIPPIYATLGLVLASGPRRKENWDAFRSCSDTGALVRHERPVRQRLALRHLRPNGPWGPRKNNFPFYEGRIV